MLQGGIRMKNEELKMKKGRDSHGGTESTKNTVNLNLIFLRAFVMRTAGSHRAFVRGILFPFLLFFVNF
jgi:hypothetical protein